MKRSFIYLLFSLFVCLSSCGTKESKTIYFVRHAEKDSFNPKDPALTIDGVMRSVDLAQWFDHITVDTIFSSDTKRTLETAKPLSEKKELTVGGYDPMAFEQFAETLLNLEMDTIVVIGHSNTILKQIEALGAADLPQKIIGEQEYDKIFQLDLPSKEVKVHQYGSKSK